MEKNEEFEIWMSKVEHQLEMMLKKSPSEFSPYDYYDDFVNNTKPEVTAIRVIRRNRRPFNNRYSFN